MGSFSIYHWIVLGVVVMLLFGRGRISELMGDVAKGINSFKKGLAEGEQPAAKAPPAQLSDSAGTPSATTTQAEDARR